MAFQGPERMCGEAGGHSAGVTFGGQTQGGMWGGSEPKQKEADEHALQPRSQPADDRG